MDYNRHIYRCPRIVSNTLYSCIMAVKNCSLDFIFKVCIIHIAILSIIQNGKSAAASIRYDQSQFGDYNVEIQLKNIELYAILDEGLLNSEYDYDYSELTEKPSSTSTASGQQQWSSTINATTVKPTHSTVASGQSPTSTAAAAAAAAANNNNTSNPLGSINSSAIVITNQLLATPQRLNITVEDDNSIKIRKCAPGYFRDNLGRCRRLRKPHLPFMQMVHTPGVIKSFQQLSPETNTSSLNSIKSTE